ncbi:uncharacterized protein LAESUDRAFT_701194 [Laetiporus sulphureus 93-53]|uniref:Tethering factor for nuclear proteasome STS1 n=1 Tax=Laetiporus sulphureus 93-53 TaxID=1314785 RepID=A0A165DXY3_9APHY|nr:uncharacterized protein LAESUDRAFT_701194 [Laetiporus sulphureus 93-53]KZT05848.1 hypothetical protein LAESUDRAFT_701194 [Laetiporus sulphureus 93-53]
MANVVTHPHLQVDFHRGRVNHSPSPLGFGFGLSSTSSMTGWPSHAPQSPWNLPINTQYAQTRPGKRRHEADEESENRQARDEEMDRSPTPERPKRAAPKRARTTSALATIRNDEKGRKDGKTSSDNDESDVDVGVLLASLPSQALLPLLMALLAKQPSLKSTVLSLIPRPTLETATQALTNAASKLRDAYPYSNSPFSQPGPSNSFGLSGGSFGSSLSNAPSTATFGFGRAAFGTALASSHASGGMRDEYILSRLRPHITEFVTTCFSYFPYFSYVAPRTTLGSPPSSKSHTQSHAAALQSQHKDRSHPTETFLFLSTLTTHILQQPPLTQSALIPLILPRLLEEWNAWVDRVDQVVNREGGMFGSETVRGWERALDEYAQAKGYGLEALRQVRDHWVAKVGWLVGRQAMEEV